MNKLTIRDRRGDRPDVSGTVLESMARRMFKTRCSILNGDPNSNVGTVVKPDGRVIGEVCIHGNEAAR
jgi:uncharacterized Zn-binding protein involved in type VI secretion